MTRIANMKRILIRICILLSPVLAFGQEEGKERENGAVNTYLSGGWSFGTPAVRAVVITPGRIAISPEKNRLSTGAVGVGIRWKYLVPFAEVSFIDLGKAYAQVGSFRSEIQGEANLFHGGVRLIRATSKFRPFVQFGLGVLHENSKGNFIISGRSSSFSMSGSAASFAYGGGVQVFAGRKWGTTVEFDGDRINRELSNGHKNFGRLQFGVFYQTKSSIK